MMSRWVVGWLLPLAGVAVGQTTASEPRDLYEALLEALREPVSTPVGAGETFSAEAAPTAEALEFFERDVRPILAERCYECHGPETQKSGLRLDSRSGAVRGGDGGPAVVPGDSGASRMIAAVRRSGELKMPPDEALTEEEIARLARWVELGAPWPVEDGAAADLPLTMAERIEQARAEHWAFQPVRQPAPPDVGAGSPIDAFVQARLDSAGLPAASAADRRTLIRRLSFDLTGLPPTFDEVEAFVSDTSPDAYETLVDRLLASPRYGERWGRYWLDLARYSDTKGYVFQEDRNYAFSHTYRDYVIQAYNEDLPYDEFIVHQLAADQVELGEDKRPLAAMGFLTLGRRFINNIHDITDDRIDVVTRGLQGLTVTCARCHDHKYDPITAADYYSLYGVFRSSHEPGELPLIETPDPNDEAYQEYERQLGSARGDLDAFMHARYVELSKHARERVGAYLQAAYDARDMAEQGDVQALAKERELHWQLVQRWRDVMKAEETKSDAILGAWAAYGALPVEGFAEAATPITTQIAEGELAVNALLREALKAKPPASMEEVAAIYGELFARADDEWLQRVAVAYQLAALTEGTPPELPDALPDANLEAFRQKLYTASTPAFVPRTQVEEFLDIPTRDRITQLRLAVQRVENTHSGRPDRAMVMVDSGQPFEPYVFKRGKPENKGEDVPRQYVELLARGERTPFGEGSGRLELARAIADPANPLTARVYVNRVWMQLFGEPLVDTPSDFGLRSEPPTHPELLDWLAAEFMERGWSTKRLIKTIVMSDAYRRSSIAPRDVVAGDPENDLLARQNRKRLDFEALRDAWLIAAGTLDETMGGPSVEITAPPYPPRRTVYSRIERQNLPAVFRTFDFASPDAHSPARYFTTAPQQALFAMNSPFVIQQARTVVERDAVAATEDTHARIAKLYRVAYQRDPEAREIEAGVDFIERLGGPEGPAGPPPPAWQYGYGSIDAETGAVARFTALPHFGDGTWKGGASLPDDALGWVSLTATGGHPGGDADHAAIRRWVAPYDALVNVNGELRHGSEQGDGVRGFVIKNGTEHLWSATVLNGSSDVSVELVTVAAGDTLDFILGPGTNESFDSFRWTPHISAVEALGDARDEGGRALEWHARGDFSGPPPALPAPLTPWEAYAQVLMLANEFVFVD